MDVRVLTTLLSAMLPRFGPVRAGMRRWALPCCGLALLLLTGGVGCSDNEADGEITGPDLPTGAGRVYPVREVTFTSMDGVPVSALFGQPATASDPLPVVILVHDLSATYARDEWVLAGLFEELLESGYLPLAIDLRGHGRTPLPSDGRTDPGLQYADLEDFHLDVQAALTWLQSESSADAARVAIVGNGVGGNVAYVSMGAFPDQLRAGVAISAGLWENPSQNPLVIGAGLAPFAPHSMLYVVGSNDTLEPAPGETLSYASFATALASLTQEPKSLNVLEGQSGHGLSLLNSSQVVDLILSWLEAQL